MTTETERAIADLAGMLAAMEQVPVTQSSTAFTVRELMGFTGQSERRCVEVVRRGIQSGIVRPTRKRITDMSGRTQAVPAYEPVKQ